MPDRPDASRKLATEPRGRVAVVTGASSGIGAALARELAARGARVALVARRRDRLEALADEIAAAGGEASAFVCDVADAAAVAEAHAAVVAALGPVERLVNAAGYVRHVPFADHDPADVERMMRTNWLGTVAWIQAVLPAMRAARRGGILNVSSFAGLAAQPDEAAYSATKAAVTALSEALSYEVARDGVHVMVVHPVLVETEMFTSEVMARMPKGSERRFVSAEAFAKRTLRAFERGERSVLIPRRYRGVLWLRALFTRAITADITRGKRARSQSTPR
ncbi:MAG TPA: SDR family NAD(P)-dependent oxidoreductase [Myxococcota bacterium]|nr:SDR family NAD(P)-dependent oxidoreductase [Myxococcota bacterium]